MSEFKGRNHPVDSVTWSEASQYCSLVGGGGRLPSETEWEYALRAGGKEQRYGDLESIAWYSGGSSHKVGGKVANRWGLNDMLGNVWEWTASKDDTGSYVLRGGSWVDDPAKVRASYRNGRLPVGRYSVIGFRCLRELIPSFFLLFP